MMPKDKVISSLQTAQTELDKALEQLARMPAYDASRVSRSSGACDLTICHSLIAWKYCSLCHRRSASRFR